jgi:hypothetical protein
MSCQGADECKREGLGPEAGSWVEAVLLGAGLWTSSPLLSNYCGDVVLDCCFFLPVYEPKSQRHSRRDWLASHPHSPRDVRRIVRDPSMNDIRQTTYSQVPIRPCRSETWPVGGRLIGAHVKGGAVTHWRRRALEDHGDL